MSGQMRNMKHLDNFPTVRSERPRVCFPHPSRNGLSSALDLVSEVYTELQADVIIVHMSSLYVIISYNYTLYSYVMVKSSETAFCIK
jgi:hypothetical protein